MFVIAATAVYWLTAPHVPAGRLTGWAMLNSGFIAIWLWILATMAVRRPQPAELVQIWGRAARFLIYGSHVIVMLAIWGLLPFCPPALQHLLALLFLFNSPVQIIASPESVTANRIGVIMTSGSLMLWLALYGDAVAVPIIGFTAMLGAALLLLANIIPKTVNAVVAERLESDLTVRLLNEAIAQVAAERDAKTRFIATASHDLGQPLQAASLFFDQLQRAPDQHNRAIAADGVRRAFAAADQLLGHMLNHLRLEADKVEPIATQVSLGPLLARVAAQHALAAAAVNLRIRLVPTRAEIRLDPVLLERALGNLLANAIQHSGGDAVLIGVRQHGVGWLRLWVIDNGSGIGSADARRIFDDYYRGSDSRAAVKSGFGLGLASVRRIGTLMNGSVGLSPAWRRGAAFFMEFPHQSLPKRTRQFQGWDRITA